MTDFRHQPHDADGNPTMAPSFMDSGGYAGVYLCWRWVVVQGTIDIHDYDLQHNMKLQGGYRRIYSGGGDPVDGDYMEMSVVDKNNYTGMFNGTNPNGMNPTLIDLDLEVGVDVLELFKYVRNEQTDIDDISIRIEYLFSSATFVPSGLFPRAKYDSDGTGDDIILKCGYKGYES